MVEATLVSGDSEEAMLAHIHEHVPGWAHVTSADQLEFKRLSGLSNACFRVQAKDASLELTPNALLFRKFACEIVDKKKEAMIFQAMSN